MKERKAGDGREPTETSGDGSVDVYAEGRMRTEAELKRRLIHRKLKQQKQPSGEEGNTTSITVEEGATFDKVNGPDGHPMLVDEQAAQAKQTLLAKIQNSDNAIHVGIEKALLSIIAKKLADMAEEKRGKVLQIAKSKAAEKFRDWGLEQLHNPAIRAAAKKIAGVASGVMDLKEAADAAHDSDIATTEAKTVQDLATAIEKNASTRYIAARNYVGHLDAQQCIDLAAGVDASPEFPAAQVAMEFQAVLEEALRDSGVLTAAEQIDSVQRTMNLQYEDSGK